MKIFSRALLAFILAATAAPLAQAGLTIVSGNVYDLGKYSYSGDIFEQLEGPTNKDTATCWAAASSNIIQHWQDQYYDSVPHTNKEISKEYYPQIGGIDAPTGSNGNEFESPVGTGSLEVYDYILKYWSNAEGLSANAISWWMQGPTNGSSYVSTGSIINNPGVSLTDPEYSSKRMEALYAAGFYTDVFGTSVSYANDPSLQKAAFYSTQLIAGNSSTPKMAENLNAIESAFSNAGQAATLNVVQYSTMTTGAGHVITCWGYETDSDQKITSLILTDSDDKQFGTFMVSVSETENGYLKIHTDRFGSWYYGDYVVTDVTYINTPEKMPNSQTKVAVKLSETARPEYQDLSSISQSGNLSHNVSTKDPVRIKGGEYDDSGTPSATVFTSTKDAKISISDTDNHGQALLTIDNGAMALLYGGLDVQGNEQTVTGKGGVVVYGHMYAHGGEIIVKNCKSNDSGAGLYAAASQNLYLATTSYIEIRGANDVTISGNTSSMSYMQGGGGGIAADDSFSLSSNKNVALNDNRIEGHVAFGGASYASLSATMNGNSSLSFANNKVESDYALSGGGAHSAMFSTINNTEGAVIFSNNSVSVTNDRGSSYTHPETQKVMNGAEAYGGAIATYFFVPSVDQASGKYLPSTLSIAGSGSVAFTNNQAEAANNSWQTGKARALGGAVYLDSLKGTGSIASISGTKGEITFSGNKASASSSEGHASEAQGGAIYISDGSNMTISQNQGNISFSENAVSAQNKAQGGAVYNNGFFSVSENTSVAFSRNQATEGADLYNDSGSVAEFVWNDSVSFESSDTAKASVVNKGDLYFATKEGKAITFTNSALDTKEGKVHLGTDSSNRTGEGSISFSNSAGKKTTVSAAESVAELSKLELSADIITGTGIQNTTLGGVNIETSANLGIQELTLKSNVGFSGEGTVALQTVVIDLTGNDYSEVRTESGICYVYDLTDMMKGALTLNNVTFKASPASGDLSSFENGKDAIAFNFGDDTNILEAKSITLDIDGVNTKYLTSKTGAVYFGENVNPPDIDVPEPATGILALVGLAGLAGRRRRK